MTNIPALSDSLSEGGIFRSRTTDPLAPRMAALAESGCAAASAAACVLGWSGSAGFSCARAPADDPQFDGLQKMAVAMLAKRIGAAKRVFRAAAAEFAGAGGSALWSSLEFNAATASAGKSSAIAILLTEPAREPGEIEALLHLTLNAALAAMSEQEAADSLRFWKERAVGADGELARTKLGAARGEAERKRIEDAVSEAGRAATGDALSRAGRIVADFGRFDAWLVATREGDLLRVGTCSLPAARRAKAWRFDARSSVFQSFRNGTPILGPSRDSPFGDGFACWLCVPWSGGVVALAARRPIDATETPPIAALVGRLAPMMEASRLAREAEEQRVLMRDLGMRAYRAVDAERARIARDLHDNEAQLLAAARIAIEAPRAKARTILGRLEKELRERVRAIHPALLGRMTLTGGLETEIGRLTEAGIEARLVWVQGRRPRLPRSLENVLYQVAREAAANLIRHSRARCAEFRIERIGEWVRLSIIDDGRGIRKGSSKRGTGLRGLAERVALIGGRMKIESRPGRTVVISEVPALASSTARSRP